VNDGTHLFSKHELIITINVHHSEVDLSWWVLWNKEHCVIELSSHGGINSTHGVVDSSHIDILVVISVLDLIIELIEDSHSDILEVWTSKVVVSLWLTLKHSLS
jgi:hypothetical protein